MFEPTLQSKGQYKTLGNIRAKKQVKVQKIEDKK
jgi:hypothetical protein